MGSYRIGAGIFAIDKKGRFLLLRRCKETSYPMSWSIPGGSMEAFDCDGAVFPKDNYQVPEFWNCAVRETREETELDFSDKKNNILCFNLSDSSEFTYKYMTFLVIEESLEELIKSIKLDTNENIDYNIFSFQEVESMTRHSEYSKNEELDEVSIHPGLCDVIEWVKNEFYKYIEKLK